MPSMLAIRWMRSLRDADCPRYCLLEDDSDVADADDDDSGTLFARMVVAIASLMVEC